MIEFVVLGCSGSYGAPPGGACSGYLVRSGSTAVWIDCGNGTLVNLQRHLPLDDLTAAVPTHRHPDHCVDILGLHIALKYGPGRTGFPVFAGPQVKKTLDPVAGGFGDTFDWHEVGDGDEREVGDLTLRFSETDHSVPTLAVEVSDGERRVVYTSDTGPGWDPASAFGAGIDLLVAEASFQDDVRGGGKHLTAREAGEAGRRSGARRLVITHLWPTLDPSVSIREAEEGFGSAVTLAAPHLTVRV
ncbi:MAG TPA: MBL fold metallo-hydrolase [Acidimicrobiia bacterium]|nr:MBL fold metallo-hydrolase [Acidimicrobiia bacterium]